jgi:hypothetical protein
MLSVEMMEDKLDWEDEQSKTRVVYVKRIRVHL